MLRRHYLPDGRPPSGIFAAEIESPDGRRRADALWAPWSIASGAALIGHEIKVSRADVLTELADPMKAEPWARYCSQWWLVVAHPSIVGGLDIPEVWGVMAPPSGRRTRTMTVVRQAPRLKPVDTGPAWRRVAAWDHQRLSDRLREAEYEASRHKSSSEHLQRTIAERELAGLGRESPHAMAVGRVLAELEQHRWSGGPFEVDEIVAAIRDVGAYRQLARRFRQEIEYLADEARRLLAPVDRVAGDLKKLADRDAR